MIFRGIYQKQSKLFCLCCRISYIKFCLCGLTCSVGSRNFQVWSPFCIYFNPSKKVFIWDINISFSRTQRAMKLRYKTPAHQKHKQVLKLKVNFEPDDVEAEIISHSIPFNLHLRMKFFQWMKEPPRELTCHHFGHWSPNIYKHQLCARHY